LTREAHSASVEAPSARPRSASIDVIALSHEVRRSARGGDDAAAVYLTVRAGLI